jgi:hypothetical protein
MTPGETTSATGQVEVLQDRLRRLLRERESLRTVEPDRAALERNRRAIVEAQWELSRALIARHHPSFQAA